MATLVHQTLTVRLYGEATLAIASWCAVISSHFTSFMNKPTHCNSRGRMAAGTDVVNKWCGQNWLGQQVFAKLQHKSKFYRSARWQWRKNTLFTILTTTSTCTGKRFPVQFPNWPYIDQTQRHRPKLWLRPFCPPASAVWGPACSHLQTAGSSSKRRASQWGPAPH